jgi:hypothetical protein
MNRRRLRALAQCSVNPALTVPPLTLVMVLKSLSAALEATKFHCYKDRGSRYRALCAQSGLPANVRPTNPSKDFLHEHACRTS